MIRVCIAGNSGHAATVTRALPRLPQVEIAGWCRAWDGEPMSEVLEDFQKLGLHPTEYPDYQTMVREAKPDVLVVDGQYGDHEDMTIWALEQGLHVYCDKPLALSLEGLERVRAAAEAAPGVLWAMQTARYDPWFYTAHKLIEARAVGEVRLLSAQKSYRLGTRADFFRDRVRQGGLIPWVAIHGIDFIRYMCPLPVEAVFAAHSTVGNGGYGDLEATSQLMMTMQGGVCAQVSADYLRPANAPTHGDDRVRVVGTEGVLEVRDDKVWLINADHDGVEPEPLMDVPAIFEDFIHTLEGAGLGLLDMEESFEDSRLALLARDAADLLSFGKRK
ncbi:MAG: Gfo/Idh/MocA family oxidoreductase [Butyricicoccus sp.]|nr:Gfo/Idh/MocA family oxidoreductase [Butyricicoccus sp.]